MRHFRAFFQKVPFRDRNGPFQPPARGLIFLFRILNLSVLSIHSHLTSCKNQKNSISGFLNIWIVWLVRKLLVCILYIFQGLWNKRFLDHSFFKIFCSNQWDLSIRRKKVRYFEKKFTDCKKYDVTFWRMGGVKILSSSTLFNFGTLKSHWNKKLILASIGKRDIFFDDKSMHLNPKSIMSRNEKTTLKWLHCPVQSKNLSNLLDWRYNKLF